MRHNEAVLTSRAAGGCGGGGGGCWGCAPKGVTIGGVVMETVDDCNGDVGVVPGEVILQAITHQHTLTRLDKMLRRTHHQGREN